MAADSALFWPAYACAMASAAIRPAIIARLAISPISINTDGQQINPFASGPFFFLALSLPLSSLTRVGKCWVFRIREFSPCKLRRTFSSIHGANIWFLSLDETRRDSSSPSLPVCLFVSPSLSLSLSLPSSQTDFLRPGIIKAIMKRVYARWSCLISNGDKYVGGCVGDYISSSEICIIELCRPVGKLSEDLRSMIFFRCKYILWRIFDNGGLLLVVKLCEQAISGI